MLFSEDPQLLESEAQTQLDPIHEALRDIVLSAAKELKSAGDRFPDLALAYEYMSLRQHTMNSLVVVKVRDAVASGRMPDAELATVHKFDELKVGNIDIRFKQVRKDGTSSNFPTRTSRLYKNQLPLIGEAIALDSFRVTLGWRWNAAATEIEDITVVYAKGEDTQWMYSILDTGQTTLAISDGNTGRKTSGLQLPTRKTEGQ